MESAASQQIRVGILGFGGAGMAHYRYYSLQPRCRVVRIYDPKPEGRLRAAQRAPQVEATGALDGVFRDLDAVSICTPDDTHADLVCAALAHGVHVLCEKPLTNTLEGIRRILAAAQASRTRLAVLHQMRFLPLFERMKARIDEGAVGRIAYLEGYYVHDLTQRAFANDDWRETSDATPMVYAGCHFADLLRWLTGEEPEEAYAMAGHVAFPRYPEADLTSALFRFPSGAVGNVLVSIGTAGAQDHSLRVYGERACIDNAALFGRGGEWLETLHAPMLFQGRLIDRRRLRHPRTAWRELYGNLNLRAWLSAWLFRMARRRLLGGGGGSGQYAARHDPIRLYEHQLACLKAVDNFVAAIDGRERVLCSPEDSARTVLACLAAVDAYRSNRPQTVRKLEEVV